jgi:hypothetical protein
LNSRFPSEVAITQVGSTTLICACRTDGAGAGGGAGLGEINAAIEVGRRLAAPLEPRDQKAPKVPSQEWPPPQRPREGAIDGWWFSQGSSRPAWKILPALSQAAASQR